MGSDFSELPSVEGPGPNLALTFPHLRGESCGGLSLRLPILLPLAHKPIQVLLLECVLSL
jgi:hypothetical protein